MSRLTIADLEASVAALDPKATDAYVYVEAGKYKAYAVPTVMAAARRGYRVTKVASTTYEVRRPQQVQA